MFPFDVQNCKLKFGSWTYHNKSIDLVIKADHFEDWNSNETLKTQAFEDWYSSGGYEKSGVSTVLLLSYLLYEHTIYIMLLVLKYKFIFYISVKYLRNGN